MTETAYVVIDWWHYEDKEILGIFKEEKDALNFISNQASKEGYKKLKCNEYGNNYHTLIIEKHEVM